MECQFDIVKKYLFDDFYTPTGIATQANREGFLPPSDEGGGIREA